MSEHDCYLIRRHPDGGYAVLRAGEDDSEPAARPGDPRFDTVADALGYALDEAGDGAVRVHPECDSDAAPDVMLRDALATDPISGSAYLLLNSSRGGQVHRTVPAAANLDLDEDGQVIGVEILGWPSA